MKKIVGYFENEERVTQAAEALHAAGYQKNIQFLFQGGVEIDETSSSDTPGKYMLTLVVRDAKMEPATTIMKNGGALEVNNVLPDWNPNKENWQKTLTNWSFFSSQHR